METARAAEKRLKSPQNLTFSQVSPFFFLLHVCVLYAFRPLLICLFLLFVCSLFAFVLLFVRFLLALYSLVASMKRV